MLVKALREHTNPFGPAFLKRTGDEYEHPAPETDVAFGYIEVLPPPPPVRRKRKVKANAPDANKSLPPA